MIGDLLKGMRLEDKKKLFDLLPQQLTVLPDLSQEKSVLNVEKVVACPLCNSDDFIGHGSYRGRRRYKCKS